MLNVSVDKNEGVVVFAFGEGEEAEFSIGLPAEDAAEFGNALLRAASMLAQHLGGRPSLEGTMSGKEAKQKGGPLELQDDQVYVFRPDGTYSEA